MNRKTLRWTAAGALVTAVGVVVAIVLFVVAPSGDGDGSQTISGDGNQQAGDGGIVAGGDVNIQQFREEVRDLGREEAERYAEQFRNVPPPTPAPFLVIDAPRHLFVRSDGTVDGHRIGAVYNRAYVWAECVLTTEFDPELRDEPGPEWLRIYWHTDEPNEEMAAAPTSGQYRGWVYAGLTLPAGHNGQLPDCAEV